MDDLSSIIAFHTVERNVFERLLDIGKDPNTAKKIIALWLWMESNGFYEFVEKVRSHSNTVLRVVAAEAESCLACLDEVNPIRPVVDNDIPITAAIADQPIALRYFHLHRDFAISGISRIVNGLCSVIFEDIVEERAVRIARAVLFGEGSSRQGSVGIGPNNIWAGLGRGLELPVSRSSTQLGYLLPEVRGLELPVSRPSTQLGYLPPEARGLLNPQARPWSPVINQTAEDDRCLFVTFSRGHPLTKAEIMGFFNKNYGDCIENVYVENGNTADGPLYGRVIFNEAYMIPVLLNGEEKVKFNVNGKPLWGRKYTPGRRGVPDR